METSKVSIKFIRTFLYVIFLLCKFFKQVYYFNRSFSVYVSQWFIHGIVIYRFYKTSKSKGDKNPVPLSPTYFLGIKYLLSYNLLYHTNFYILIFYFTGKLINVVFNPCNFLESDSCFYEIIHTKC